MVRDDGQRPGDLADNTARNQVGPLNQFKAELNALYAALLSPPYRDLETQADLAGIRLSRSTIGDLLTRDVRPTWRTVDKFVRACRLYRNGRS